MALLSESHVRSPFLRPALSLILSLAAFTVPSTAQISLTTAVSLAQRNSSAVKLAQADLNKTAALLAESKDVFIPNLLLGSSIGPPSIGFTFSQPSIASASMQSLAYSHSQKQYIEAAEKALEAAGLALKDAQEQVALEASTEYVELDAVTRELEAGHQQAEFAQRLLSIEQQRAEAGVDPQSEVLQARLKAAQLKLSIMHLQSRAASLISQLSVLTGLPPTSIQAISNSVPTVPAIQAEQPAKSTYGLEAAQAQAASRQHQARGDFFATRYWPVIGFGAQYNRDATSLNNYNIYFSAKRKFKADNFSAGFNIQIPIYDRSRRDKSMESAAEALRATAEVEQAQRQNEVQIATLTGSLGELEALAEVASLKQEIAAEQLKTVQAELQTGNGAGAEPGAQPQQSPKLEQLARIDERQKVMEALDAGLDLTKARLNLLRALGHMDDWLHLLPAEVPAKAPRTAPQ